MSVDADAMLWLKTATPDQIRAWALFREIGCPSCGQSASPGCSCWRIREIEYLPKVMR